MKKLLLSSLVAMLAVSTANAKIASSEWVEGRLGDIPENSTVSDAYKAADNNALSVAQTYTDTKIQGLDGASSGQGNHITGVSQADGKVTVTKGTISYNTLSDVPVIDEGLSNTSTNAVQNKAVKAALDGKQAKLTNTNIKGSGSVAVNVDEDGVITVSGTDNNTTYNTGTAATSGLTKLYTSTGANTDGTMTQKAITDGLAGKQDKLTNTNIKGSGSVAVNVDANGVITVSGTDNNTTYNTGTATTSGLTKLYTSTGTNTDGTMTQNAITSTYATKEELGKITNADDVETGDGSYILTKKVANGVTTYIWESIDRAAN